MGTAGSVAGFLLTIFYQGETHMFAKFITAGLVGSALLATVAFAQSPTAPSDRSVYNNNNESIGAINDLLTEKDGKIKAVVIGVGGFLGIGEHLVAIPFEKVKFVNEPIVYSGAAGGPSPAGNRPASSTTTGAAGTNTGPSAMPVSKPNPWYPDHAVFNATKDELKAMPEFKYAT